MTQAEQGQLPEKLKEDMQSVTGRSNDTDTCIGGTSGRNVEKAGPKAGSVHSIENRQLNKIEGEKHQFIRKKVSVRYECNVKRGCQAKRGSD